MAASGLLLGITLKLLYFFVPESLVWILVKKVNNRFKFRFKRAEGHRHLKPFAKTWIVAVVIFFITLLSRDIFEFFMGQRIHDWLAGFGGKLGLITVCLAGFDFLWVYNYLLEKRWDKISWIISAIIALFVILFFSA